MRLYKKLYLLSKSKWNKFTLIGKINFGVLVQPISYYLYIYNIGKLKLDISFLIKCDIFTLRIHLIQNLNYTIL